MKKIVIVTLNAYPNGDAGAIRQHVTAKLFCDLGYEVYVAGYGESTYGNLLEYEGIKYISFRSKSKTKIVRLINRLLFGEKVISFIKKHGDGLEAILTVDVLPNAFSCITRFAKKNQVLLLHDSVEWYSPEEFEDGERNIEYRLKEYTNTKVIQGNWRVMAISSYLKNYFSKCCKVAVRIPVIMDVNAIVPKLVASPKDKIRFVYAGSPGRKDYLKEIVEGFCILSSEQKKLIELNIIGVNEDQLFEICGLSKELIEQASSFMKAHGRVKHTEATEAVKNADYTLLLRDESLRYAIAGFPTKVVESLAHGTPVVCNLSSDLGDYLEDGKNSIIVDNHTPLAMREALIRVLKMTDQESNAMRYCARKTAEENFDYRLYKTELSKLLQQ